MTTAPYSLRVCAFVIVGSSVALWGAIIGSPIARMWRENQGECGMTKITEAKADELRALCERPWFTCESEAGNRIIAAAARTAIPALLNEREELKAEIKRRDWRDQCAAPHLEALHEYQHSGATLAVSPIAGGNIIGWAAAELKERGTYSIECARRERDAAIARAEKAEALVSVKGGLAFIKIEQDRAIAAEAALSAALSREKVLREALEPFAEMKPISWSLEADHYFIDTADITAARAALNASKKETGA